VRVLVVEDEPSVADFVARGLRGEGYDVIVARDGVEGEQLALADDVDLVVLDWMLPERDGLEVLERIRARRRELPVIVLTARRTVSDRVLGLDRGATDYVTKPFAFAELAARVRAHLRSTADRSGALQAAGIRLDFVRREVWRGDQPIQLTSREFELLAFFLRHPDEVLSRERILDAVWADEFEVTPNVVEVYVGYLRRKLAGPDGPAPIETVRSVGYRLSRG